MLLMFVCCFYKLFLFVFCVIVFVVFFCARIVVYRQDEKKTKEIYKQENFMNISLLLFSVWNLKSYVK